MNEKKTGGFNTRSRPLENDDFEKIANRAAEIVMDQVALRIGQGVIKMTIFLFAAAVLAATAWVTGKDLLK